MRPAKPTGNRPVLAFDTSGPLGTVAIGTAEQLLVEVTIGVNARHAEALLPAIDFAVRQAGLERGDLGAIVVGAGPGSFTGVRIAAATAKGLAAALTLPLHAFSSLAMVSAGAGRPEAVCALFDARRGEVYAACYRFDYSPALTAMAVVLAPCAGHVEAIVESLSEHAPLYVGDGAVRYTGEIESAGGRVGPDILATPRASLLLRLLALAGEGARVQDPHRWTPEYVRAPGVTVPSAGSAARTAG